MSYFGALSDHNACYDRCADRRVAPCRRKHNPLECNASQNGYHLFLISSILMQVVLCLPLCVCPEPRYHHMTPLVSRFLVRDVDLGTPDMWHLSVPSTPCSIRTWLLVNKVSLEINVRHPGQWYDLQLLHLSLALSTRPRTRKHSVRKVR